MILDDGESRRVDAVLIEGGIVDNGASVNMVGRLARVKLLKYMVEKRSGDVKRQRPSPGVSVEICFAIRVLD